MSITEVHEAQDEIIEWRPWPRDPRYIVGADSTIIGPSGRPLKPSTWAARQVFSRRWAGERVQEYVAVTICETFHGPRPAGMHAAHEDGNSLNDRADNLSWKTPKENAADKILHGTQQIGERNPYAKLTEEKVREFRRRHAAGEAQTDIARDFGITPVALSMVHRGLTWSHVQ